MLKSAILDVSKMISNDHFKRVIANNLFNGKLMRGQLTLNISQTNKQHAALLGACTEYLQSSYLILDDIMDNSEYRRGQLAWHKQVGNSAINDGIFLRELIHIVLKNHFESHTNYLHLVDLFNTVHFCTMFGQQLDMVSHPDHFAICKYKTSYYTFYLPIMLALLNDNAPLQTAMTKPVHSTAWQYKTTPIHLFNTPLITSANTLQGHVHELCLDLGYYFQSQDDLLDILPKHLTGKDQYQDVYANKTTWLSCEIYRQSNRKLSHKEQIEWYQQHDITSAFEQFEQWIVNRILNRLQHFDEAIQLEVHRLLKQLKSRKK